MTDDERRGLRAGDRVMVRADDGTEAEWVVSCAPIQLYSSWAVWLEGKVGFYDLSRVTALVSRAAGSAPNVSRADVAALLAELDRLRADARQGLDANALLAARVAALEAELAGYGPMAEECTRLRVRCEGAEKALALMNAGMGSVCEGRDELKHDLRAAKAELQEAKARVAELLSLFAPKAG